MTRHLDNVGSRPQRPGSFVPPAAVVFTPDSTTARRLAAGKGAQPCR
jgi:hypothetical protein